jgi:hypothetical protein
MTFPFDPNDGAVAVLGDLAGPTGSIKVRLLLDTRANISVITPPPMVSVGYDTNQPLGQISLTTASSSGNSVDFFRVMRLSALGHDRADLPILCYPLPSGVDFDGLLGLDFFEGHVLTLDFVNSTVELT